MADFLVPWIAGHGALLALVVALNLFRRFVA